MCNECKLIKADVTISKSLLEACKEHKHSNEWHM